MVSPLQIALASSLRVPPISRLHRLHNVTLCLEALRSLGAIGPMIEPRHIVDGSREKTLSLIWSILAKLQLPRLIRPFSPSTATSFSDSGFAPVFFMEECFNDLLKWCQQIVGEFASLIDVRITNFSTSFNDGVALCLLIHRYLPHLLPFSEIRTLPPPPPEQERDWSARVVTFSPPRRRSASQDPKYRVYDLSFIGFPNIK